MKRFPLLSIIIATFNSECTLPRVLRSIRAQTYPQSSMEIIIVDGGSSDRTLLIADKFNCKIINNTKIFPQWAKYLGYKEAKGNYAMFLDSDEVIKNINSIKRKVELLQDNFSVRAVVGSGYITPAGYNYIAEYLNEFGDPFSFFIYRLSKNDKFFLKTMTNRYNAKQISNNYIIFNFSKTYELPIIELAALGSIIDLNYVKKNFPKILNEPWLIWHIFNLLISKNADLGILIDDPLIHYSTNNLTNYLTKIRSRVIWSVYAKSKEGYMGRSEFDKAVLRYKKYLFFPYSLSFVFPAIDSIYLAFTRRNLGYLIHLPLCLYTTWLIAMHSALKILGFKNKLSKYG